MRLRDIAVRVEELPASHIGGIRPILHEIETLLAAFIKTGQGGSIDLRSLRCRPSISRRSTPRSAWARCGRRFIFLARRAWRKPRSKACGA